MAFLHDIASIRLGVTSRGGFQNKKVDGNIYFLQPRDITGGVLNTEPVRIAPDEDSLLKKHLLEAGDLLLVNKGLNFGTFLFENELKKCVASNSFFVIKANEQKCLPEFLQWFLEQEQTKEALSKKAITVTVPSLAKSALEKLAVPLPSLALQKKIRAFLIQNKRSGILLQNMIRKSIEYRDSYIWEFIQQ